MNEFGRWVDFYEELPPKNTPIFAKAGGHLLLCSPIGGKLHITDCEQCQYVFEEGERIEVRGKTPEFWLDLECGGLE